MSQTLAQLELNTALVSQLMAFCDIPFEPEQISAMAAANNWPRVSDSDWSDNCIEIELPASNRSFIAVWPNENSHEKMAGTPIAVLYIDDATEEPMADELSWESFDHLYEISLKECTNILGAPTRGGAYQSESHRREFAYAFFQRSTVMSLNEGTNGGYRTSSSTLSGLASFGNRSHD